MQISKVTSGYCFFFAQEIAAPRQAGARMPKKNQNFPPRGGGFARWRPSFPDLSAFPSLGTPARSKKPASRSPHKTITSSYSFYYFQSIFFVHMICMAVNAPIITKIRLYVVK
jgi:hypothetical protein